MRILLCDQKTGLYFKTEGEWTADSDHACNFHSGPRAILFARENGLEHAEVFWDFDDPEYSVRLPVAPAANPSLA